MRIDTTQLDTRTRGVRFKGSLTSDRGFFSSVKQRVRFHSIRLTRKRGGDAKMGRGIKEIAMIDEMKEERERKSKKKITSAARLLGEDLLSTLVRLRSPFPNTTLHHNSVQLLPRNSTLLPFCFLPGTLSSPLHVFDVNLHD